MATVVVDDRARTAGIAVAPRGSDCLARPDHADALARPVALVVEPDTSLREGISDALYAQGIEVVETEDGLGALLELSHRAPDLVVLDMDVSHVSGHRVFRVLRSDPQTHHVPVLMLSEASCQEVCPSPREGPLPDCFLQKPVSVETVLRELLRTADLAAPRHG
jgi:CheY-like chemotaxis protein